MKAFRHSSLFNQPNHATLHQLLPTSSFCWCCQFLTWHVRDIPMHTRHSLNDLGLLLWNKGNWKLITLYIGTTQWALPWNNCSLTDFIWLGIPNQPFQLRTFLVQVSAYPPSWYDIAMQYRMSPELVQWQTPDAVCMTPSPLQPLKTCCHIVMFLDSHPHQLPLQGNPHYGYGLISSQNSQMSIF